MSRASLHTLLGLVTLLWAALAPRPARAESSGARLFELRCRACHSIGEGPRLGPDLQGVTGRRSEAWLRAFIVDPSRLLAARDATALQLVARSPGGLVMPPQPLTDSELTALLGYLRACDEGECPAAGRAQTASPSARSEGTIAVGLRLFSGEQTLVREGPACAGCHRLSSLPLPGGGALGPELTDLGARLRGDALLTELIHPSGPMMRALYGRAPLAQGEVEAVAALIETAQDAGGAVGWGWLMVVASLLSITLFALLGRRR